MAALNPVLARALEVFRVQQLGELAARKDDQAERRREKAKLKEAEKKRKAAEAVGSLAAVVSTKPRLDGPPVMFCVKKVLDALMAAAPGPLTVAELAEASGIDLRSDAEVAALVAANPKVRHEAGSALYAYRSVFEVGDKGAILALLRKREEGTSLAALADAYPGAKADAAELVADGAAWGIVNLVTGDTQLFPREPALEPRDPVPQAVKRLWARCEVPTDPEVLAKELARAGIVPAPRRSAHARRVVPEASDRKRKHRRDFSKLHVTNVHLWDELFAPGGAMAAAED